MQKLELEIVFDETEQTQAEIESDLGRFLFTLCKIDNRLGAENEKVVNQNKLVEFPTSCIHEKRQKISSKSSSVA